MATVSPTPNSANATDNSERLSLWTKLAYGSGDLGTAISAALRSFFLLFFFTNVAGLSAGLAGTIVLINRVWDAFNDPIVGWLSDRTTTRFGRRRPWLLWGALPFGLFFFLLWLVPPFGTWGLFAYYVVIALLLDTAYTVINVPYVALAPELTHDYDERTRLNAYRFAFSVGGALVSSALHPQIVGTFDSVRTGYVVSGAIWAIISTIPCFIVFAGTRERPEPLQTQESRADSIPFFRQVRIAFQNVAYRYVILLYLFSWLSLQLVAAVIAFYLNSYIGQPGMLTSVLLAIQGTAFIFLFVWGWVSDRIGKRHTYIIGAVIWLIMLIALYFVTPERAGWVVPLAALAGAGVSVAYLIPWAMLPDVIEFDELETGLRREGIFSGFMVFLQKTGIALGIFFLGIALEYSGYIEPTEAVPQPVQPESALQMIRLFIGPIPAAILVGSLFIAWFYPITKEKHEAARAELARRRGEVQPVREPLGAGD